MEIHIHKAHLLLEMLVVELTNSVSQVYYSIVVRKVFYLSNTQQILVVALSVTLTAATVIAEAVNIRTTAVTRGHRGLGSCCIEHIHVSQLSAYHIETPRNELIKLPVFEIKSKAMMGICIYWPDTDTQLPWKKVLRNFPPYGTING